MKKKRLLTIIMTMIILCTFILSGCGAVEPEPVEEVVQETLEKEPVEEKPIVEEPVEEELTEIPLTMNPAVEYVTFGSEITDDMISHYQEFVTQADRKTLPKEYVSMALSAYACGLTFEQTGENAEVKEKIVSAFDNYSMMYENETEANPDAWTAYGEGFTGLVYYGEEVFFDKCTMGVLEGCGFDSVGVDISQRDMIAVITKWFMDGINGNITPLNDVIEGLYNGEVIDYVGTTEFIESDLVTSWFQFKGFETAYTLSLIGNDDDMIIYDPIPVDLQLDRPYCDAIFGRTFNKVKWIVPLTIPAVNEDGNILENSAKLVGAGLVFDNAEYEIVAFNYLGSLGSTDLLYLNIGGEETTESDEEIAE